MPSRNGWCKRVSTRAHFRAKRAWRATRPACGTAPWCWPCPRAEGTRFYCGPFDAELALSTQSLSVEWIQGRLAIAGRAELRAQRLSSRLSTLRPMGSYRITVLGGATPTLQLDTLEGALQLAGSGQWVGSRLR